VFRGDLNVEQAGKSVIQPMKVRFSMIDQLQKPHTTVLGT